MSGNIWIYMLVMITVSYAIRVIPMTLLRKKIKNEFVMSFLYYVPYVTLAVMTFPAIVDATQTPLAGLLAFLIGIVSAWKGASLFKVAIICSLVVFAVEMLVC